MVIAVKTSNLANEYFSVSLYVHLVYVGNFSFPFIYDIKVVHDLRVCILSDVVQKRV
jgi:hypothetical protein